MNEGQNQLEEYIYGIATAPTKSEYNYTLVYFKHQRNYKRFTVVFLVLLTLGLAQSIYQGCMLLSSSKPFTFSFLQTLDSVVFLAVCLQSFVQLRWPHRNYILYTLLASGCINLIRLFLTSNSGLILRELYICILIGAMSLINYISSKLQDIALMLRPDENNPSARYTV